MSKRQALAVYRVKISYDPIPTSADVVLCAPSPIDAVYRAFDENLVPTHFARDGEDWRPNYWTGADAGKPHVRPEGSRLIIGRRGNEQVFAVVCRVAGTNFNYAAAVRQVEQ